MILAVPAGHRLAKQKDIEWKDFHNEPMVMIHPSLQHGYYDTFLNLCAKAGAIPSVGQYANEKVIQAYVEGQGKKYKRIHRGQMWLFEGLE